MQAKLISEDLFQKVQNFAQTSPRRRANFNFHQLEEVYQRFLNVLVKGTYIRPHKHEHPPKPETFIALKGEFGFFIFDDDGEVTEKYRISSNGPIYGIDISPNVWHCAISLTEICVCFEGKSGPYDPTKDKIFADWAPEETDENTAIYLNQLLRQIETNNP